MRRLRPRVKGFWILQNKRQIPLLCLMAAVTVFLCASFQLRLAETVSVSRENEVKLPIIMYHNVTDDPAEVGKYVILAQELEQDLAYLKQQGFTTIVTQDLINYQKQKIALPEKPVMITFDDGYYNNYQYAYPLLQTYQMKAVISTVGALNTFYTELGNQRGGYANATWAQLKEMQDSGVVEIQNHSYDLHDFARRKGVLRKKGEDQARYRQMLVQDVQTMQEAVKEQLGTTPAAFTYPFGAVDSESEEIITSLGFAVTYSCEEKVNTVTPTGSLYRLGRFNRAGDADRTAFFYRIFKEMD